MRRRMTGALSVIGSLAMIVAISGLSMAQEPAQEDQQKRPPVEVIAPPPKDAGQSDTDLRAVIKALADEVHNLTGEVKKLRRATEQNADAMQLVVFEDRLARVEDEINASTGRKAELDSSEQTIRSRLANIDQELIVRGGLNREDSEAAIRADLDRSLQNVHAQQGANQKQLAELQNEETTLRSRIEALRQKLNLDRESNGPQG